jgi:hypothetical protein
MRLLRLLVAVAALATVGVARPAAALDVPIGKFDYQLGGAYPPPAGVRIVVRDRLDSPATGKYNVCYINGFQAQESERQWWNRNHPELLLRDAAGQVVVDTNWNEALLDIRTAAKRSALLAIEGKWIDQCGVDGFKAVDPDNLDSYTRSKGLLTAAQAVAFAKLLITRAHQRSLAIAQKNSVELAGRAPFDFAVVEECQRYRECGGYKAVFGGNILEIEYTNTAFNTACTSSARTWPVIRRDLNLAVAGAPGYVYRSCV